MFVKLYVAITHSDTCEIPSKPARFGSIGGCEQAEYWPLIVPKIMHNSRREQISSASPDNTLWLNTSFTFFNIQLSVTCAHCYQLFNQAWHSSVGSHLPPNPCLFYLTSIYRPVSWSVKFTIQLIRLFALIYTCIPPFYLKHTKPAEERQISLYCDKRMSFSAWVENFRPHKFL